jgi:hypothetical protein
MLTGIANALEPPSYLQIARHDADMERRASLPPMGTNHP